MRTRYWLSTLAAGSLVLIGVAVADPLTGGAQQSATPAATTEDDQGNVTPVVGTPLLQPTIDFIRAQEIALAGQTGAVVTEVDLDGSDGVLAYDVRLDNGTEVQIDATTGAVLKTEQAGADDQNGDDDNGNGDENGKAEVDGDNGGQDAEDNGNGDNHDEGNGDQGNENEDDGESSKD